MTTPFKDLDYDIQIEHLNELVADALAVWGFTHAVADLVGYTNNAVYRVNHEHGSYALRVHRPGLKRVEWIESELAWLDDIHQKTVLRVPIPARDVFMGDLQGVDEDVPVVLFRWVEGGAIAPDALALDHIRQIGEFAALLHQYSATFRPPSGFERPKLDWDGLFGEVSPYQSDNEADLFTEAHLEVINQVTARVRAVMDASSNGLRMIHGDLIAKNILFEGDTIGVIDFDDCALGYPLYDLSPMLWVSRDFPHYPKIKAALWEGYTRVTPLSEQDKQHLEVFVAARHVASCRWIAGNAAHPALRGQAPQIIDKRVDEMRHFLATGQLFTHRTEK